MNLHSIAAPIVGIVNTNEHVLLMQNLGAATNADFSRSPSYAASQMMAQVQGLQSDDIRVVNGLGIQGTRSKAYLWGAWSGLIRSLEKGSDLIVRSDSSVWKVAYVFEDYGHGVAGSTGWCSVAIVLQNPASEDYAGPSPLPPPSPGIPSYVELGTQISSYSLPDGTYRGQRVMIIDDEFLGGQVITGNFNVGQSITLAQRGQWIEPLWDGSRWVVGSFGGVL